MSRSTGPSVTLVVAMVTETHAQYLEGRQRLRKGMWVFFGMVAACLAVSIVAIWLTQSGVFR